MAGTRISLKPGAYIKFLIIFGCAVSLSFWGALRPVWAGTSDNVTGWAWNEYYGWISFNSVDLGGTPPDYGVNIDSATGNLSGEAWSSNLGWISFNETAPDYTFNDASNGGCGSTCNGAGCTACYNLVKKQIYGWAKILSLGEDGWISLNKAGAVPASSYDYSVSLDPATNEVSGWAWNNNEDNNGIGWISFKCTDMGVCVDSDYGVYANINTKPIVSNLTAPNWPAEDACALRANKAKLKWVFSDPDAGASQGAYQCIVNSVNDPNGVNVYDSTKQTLGAATARSCIVPDGKLAYGTQYYFWIQVWDELDMPSGFIAYNSPTDTENDDGNPNTFTTYAREFPKPDFSYFPKNPSIGEAVDFDSQTRAKYYTSGDTQADCTDLACDWTWTTTTTGVPPATIAAAAASTTIITFQQTTAPETIKLEVSDGLYTCASTTIIRANKKLPVWKETGGQ